MEWQRSGIPMAKANEACGVANAATRKYLTQCHLWYFPPAEAVVRMADYCIKHGRRTKRPYFSLDGHTPITERDWTELRAKWHHTHGLTNVWHEPAVHGYERIRTNKGYFHANQKPIALMKRQIVACTDTGDVIWEPFGGMCSATIAALHTERQAFSAEINLDYFKVAATRLREEIKQINKRSEDAA
jgi:site-specific DNA-methyltransferase (adenine-specific)